MSNSKFQALFDRFSMLTASNGEVDHSAELKALADQAIGYNESARVTFKTHEEWDEANNLARLGSLAKKVATGHELKRDYRALMATENPSQTDIKHLSNSIREYILFSGIAGTLHQATEWADMLNRLTKL